MIIDLSPDPALISACDSYDAALAAGDPEALNGFFLDSPRTIRFGLAENLYGYDAIAEYRRSSRGSAGVEFILTRREIVPLTDTVAVACIENERPADDKIGRTTQVWLKTESGWRIASAHVSAIDRPAP